MTHHEEQPEELDEFMRIMSQGLDGEEFSAQISQGLDEELRLLSSYEEQQAHAGQVMVIYSNVTDTDLIALTLKLRGLPGRVVELEAGTAIVRRLRPQPKPSFAQLFASDLDGLLGDGGEIPGEVDRYARTLSELIPFGVVCMLATMEQRPAKDTAEAAPDTQDALPLAAPEETAGSVAGQVITRFYKGGQFERALPSGAFVSSLDPLLEDLLLGRTLGEPHRLDQQRLAKLGVEAQRPEGMEPWEDEPGFWLPDPEGSYE